jgi:hypothetical protein
MGGKRLPISCADGFDKQGGSSMKQVFAVAAALTVFLAVGAPIAAAKAPTAKSLQAQISSLRRDLNTTKKQLKTAQKQLSETTDLSVAVGAVAFCGLAATADAFQGTWAVDNQIAVAAGQQAIYPTQLPLNDSGICANSLRIPRSQAVPPTVVTFSALLSLLASRVAPFAVPSWWQPLGS